MLSNTIAGFGCDFASGKISEKINELVEKCKGQHDDVVLSESLRELIREEYGDETFYNDLDSFITRDRVIEQLISSAHGKTGGIQLEEKEFCNNELQKFLSDFPKYSGEPLVRTNVKQVLKYLFTKATSLNKLDPYSKAGKLQNTVLQSGYETKCTVEVNASTIVSLLNKMNVKLDGIEHLVSLSSESNGCTLPLEDCSEEIRKFNSEIDQIERSLQTNGQFKEAIDSYNELIQPAAIALRGQPANIVDSLYCRLYCKIAMCQSNLGWIDKSLQSINLAKEVAQQNDKGYNYAVAAIIIQNAIAEQYDIAETHLNIALEAEPENYKVFALRQHLYALMGKENCKENIEILDSFFATFIHKKDNENIIIDYYTERGLIHQIYGEIIEAESDYAKAMEYRKDSDLLLFNLLSTAYARATEHISKTQRSLYASPDVKLLLHVRDGLKSFFTDSFIQDENHCVLVKRAIALYASACSLLELPLGLNPVEKYLPFVRDYEIKRIIIFDCIQNDGGQRALLEDLNAEDKLLAQGSILLEEGKLDDCKNMIMQALELPIKQSDIPLVHMLLQISLMQKDTDNYWRYRSQLADVIPETALAVFDAHALNAAGKVSDAKKLIDKVITNVKDISLINNILRFYREHDEIKSYEELCKNTVSMYKNKDIVIPNPMSFYFETMSYLIEKRDPYVCELFEGIVKDELREEDYFKLQEILCIAIYDIKGLFKCCNYFFSKDNSVRNGINKALCQIILLDYAGAINTCREIEDRASKEENVKIAWILSDSFFLTGNRDDSFAYAKKAHELTLAEPANESHQNYLTRAMRCGHFEVLTDIASYQDIHPVVVNWIKQIHIDMDRPAESLLAELEKAVPKQNAGLKEDELINLYKTKHATINWLLQCEHGDWDRVFNFAKQHKLFICKGNLEQVANAARKVTSDIIVDEQTLIILEHYGCMDLLTQIPKIHICYNTVQRIQCDFYNGRYEAKQCLDWLKEANNIEYESNGFSLDYGDISTLLSDDCIYACGIAKEKEIPFLCADGVIPVWQEYVQLELLNKVSFITIPALLQRMDQSQKKSELVYHLLKECTFVSFNAQIMLDCLLKETCETTAEILENFLVFNSECEPKSFANVYLQAIDLLLERDRANAVVLGKQFMRFTQIVWNRGEYYRYSSETGLTNKYVFASSIITVFCRIMVEGIWRLFYKIDTEIANDANALFLEIQKHYGVEKNTPYKSI